MYFLHPVREDRERYLAWLEEANGSREGIVDLLEGAVLYEIEIDDREVGEAVVAEDGEGACTLRSICVVKEERRKGNGSLLMENLFFLFAPKCSLMRAEASGELEPFFTKLGFVRTGEGHAGRLAMERTLKTGCACCEKEKAERGEGV